MNVLITGASGYVGKALVDHLLDAGYEVSLYDIENGQDARDEDRLRTLDSDAVVHLAAIPGVEACRDDPEAAVRHNVEATATVARVCSERGRRLVFASSQAAHGDTMYGWTKRVGVETCRRLPDLDWVALEFSNIYGGTGKGTVVETFIEQANEDGPLTVHDPGTQERNFVHRSDVARACELALSSGSGVIPVAGPDTMTINELARQVKRRTGVSVERVDPARPIGPMEVSVDLDVAADGLGHRPTTTLNSYLDKVLGEPKREVGV